MIALLLFALVATLAYIAWLAGTGAPTDRPIPMNPRELADDMASRLTEPKDPTQ